MLTAPNLITIARLLLVPVMVYLLLEEMYGTALAVFVAAALSDAIDGFLARHFNQHSEIGAVLDPAADKLMIVCTAVTLMALKQMPAWIGTLVVLRDAVIVSGFLAYRWLRGHVEMAPTFLGKFNTGLVFLVFALVLANAAELLDTREWLPALYALLAAAIVASGVQYVWVWSQKAAHPEGGHQGSSE